MRVLTGALLVLAVLMPGPLFAQTFRSARGRDTSKVFVDVNVAGAVWSLAKPYELSLPFVQFGELATWKAAYPKPSHARVLPVVDLGGGVMVSRFVGVGVAFSRTTFQGTPGLTATIPHPTLLNDASTASGTTGTALDRTEQALHVFLAIVPLRKRNQQLRFSAGPTWYSYSAPMVQSIAVDQAVDPLTPQNTVTIAGYTAVPVHAHGPGFNVGVSYARFITPRVGLAVGVRVDAGRVHVAREPLSTVRQQIAMGGTRFLVGLRFRLD